MIETQQSSNFPEIVTTYLPELHSQVKTRFFDKKHSSLLEVKQPELFGDFM